MTFAPSTLVGSFPNAVGDLALLNYFRVDGGKALTGSIPTEFGRCTKLTDIDIGSSLTGPIPTEFGLLTSLTKLYIGNNQLTGTIPPSLAQLTLLTEISLDHNNLSGVVPELPFAHYTGKCAIYDDSTTDPVSRTSSCVSLPTT